MTTMARPRGMEETRLTRTDNMLLLSVAVLVCLGIVMVASASLHLGARNGDMLRYVDRHLLALVLGLLGAIAVYQIPTRWWYSSSTALYFVGLALLVLVVIPGLGHKVNGAQRWILLGPFSLQTSEFMKLFAVLYLAGYLVRQRLEVAHSIWAFVKPNLLLLVACALLLMQPDFGATAVLLMTAFGMLFLAGAPLWQFAALLSMAVVGLGLLIWTSPYRMERIASFLDPWEHAQDSGYQLIQALIAFGRGEWTGVGLGNGIQKQFYLPEAHTDFVMAVIGEEFGLVGTLAVIALFSLIVWRAFSIGAGAEAKGETFSGYVAYGLGVWMGLQAFINIGVNMGLLPTKGLTLPFLSYGSNSLIVCCIAIGMLERIHLENHSDADAKEGQWHRAS